MALGTAPSRRNRLDRQYLRRHSVSCPERKLNPVVSRRQSSRLKLGRLYSAEPLPQGLSHLRGMHRPGQYVCANRRAAGMRVGSPRPKADAACSMYPKPGCNRLPPAAGENCRRDVGRLELRQGGLIRPKAKDPFWVVRRPPKIPGHAKSAAEAEQMITQAHRNQGCRSRHRMRR